ncbi:hypothetical protein [Virgibacillus ndiopensis]|uniref:hypothetical protein n=1 Tax=Virgibacillus ndiopensis TaxID=2004408 RepID=UPI000C084F50|nr:hypothetical protein [Virgibacillus ndiopensis]
MQKLGIYILATIISFIGGIYAFVFTFNLLGYSLSNGDIGFLVVWISPAFLITIPLYLLVINEIDEKFNKLKFILYPLCCMLLFILPSFVIVLFLGGAQFFLPESISIYSLFITAGLIFGTCNWIIKKLFSKNDLNKN